MIVEPRSTKALPALCPACPVGDLRARSSAAALVALMLGQPALAQPLPPTSPAPASPVAAAADDPGLIVVTGSRIARPNIEAAVPVSVLTVEELTQTGDVSLGDRLNLLPAFNTTFSTQNSGRFIGTAGLNVLDLRGQGTARTLTLVNGRRHVSSDVGSSTVDTNLIATDLV